MGSVQKALNLGCGNDYRQSTQEIEWTNVDNGDCKVDFYLDIEQVPWEFKNDNGFSGSRVDYFDIIEAVQVLEHIKQELFGRIIGEMYVASKDGAEWHIAVPHAFSSNYIGDPTHTMPFSQTTFDFFIDGTPQRENGKIYGWGGIRLEHIVPPFMDSNQSIHFNLRVCK